MVRDPEICRNYSLGVGELEQSYLGEARLPLLHSTPRVSTTNEALPEQVFFSNLGWDGILLAEVIARLVLMLHAVTWAQPTTCFWSDRSQSIVCLQCSSTRAQPVDDRAQNETVQN